LFKQIRLHLLGFGEFFIFLFQDFLKIGDFFRFFVSLAKPVGRFIRFRKAS
jgi:hypothetical protein